MADGNAQSRYVRLTKEQAPVEEITPGELNQPVQVRELTVHKCSECGQPLPESYEAPADEDWITGICGCAEDPESCWTGLLCPCVLFGRNVETLREDIPWTQACACHAMCVEGGMALAAATALLSGYIDPQTTVVICEGLLFTWWMCGIYTGLFRQSLQKKYHLKNSPCDPCLVHCCMHWCAICQEHREMRKHLADDDKSSSPTIVDPPPAQEMTSDESRESEPSPSDGQHTNLELQPV